MGEKRSEGVEFKARWKFNIQEYKINIIFLSSPIRFLRFPFLSSLPEHPNEEVEKEEGKSITENGWDSIVIGSRISFFLSAINLTNLPLEIGFPLAYYLFGPRHLQLEGSSRE